MSLQVSTWPAERGVGQFGSGNAEKPFVTIVMPALNEHEYIAAAINSVIPDDDAIDYELLVLDGGSNDNTAAIVRGLCTNNKQIRLVANERKIQSAAVNKAAQIANPRSEYLVRADCHSVYSRHFVEACVKTLKEKRAASVVVSMHTEGRTPLQQAIAAAQNSRLGNGAAAHRLSGRSGYVDHGHHAAFDRRIFLELGGYDESFGYNEDAELDTRILKQNLKIYLTNDAFITYYPRRNLLGLAQQYFNFGGGRAKTFLKHGRMPKLRQLAPLMAFISCAASLVLSCFDTRFLLIPLTYVALCVGWGLGRAARERSWHLVLSGVAAMVMHMSWAAGFLFQLAKSDEVIR